jgi:hypothetical protein
MKARSLMGFQMSEAQDNWLAYIQSFPNWIPDKEPNQFLTNQEGNILWFRNGYQGLMRLRVSYRLCSLYKVTLNGHEAVQDRWYIPDNPNPETTGLVKYMNAMLKRSKGGNR